MLSLAACSVASEPPAEGKSRPAGSGTQDTGHSDVASPAGDTAQDGGHIGPGNGGGAAIILSMNGTNIHARLYDNAAADAFLDLLPYTLDEEDIPVMQALTGRVEIKVTLDESLSDPAVSEARTPAVYFTSDISPEGLLAVYESLGWRSTGKVAVKLSTGEPPASNYLRPELIADLVQSVDGTIVECNAAYGGSRAQTAMHYQVAEDHGFTEIADFQILDEDGSMTLQVSGGSVLTENYVGAAFSDYDSYLILSHFKGHAMAGYGGAIKNISIGLGSSEGKAWIHSGGTSRTNAWGGQQDAFLEAMAEAGKRVKRSCPTD